MSRRIAFVSGGSRGIGRAIVLQLVKDGFFVVFTYRCNSECAKEVERTAEELGGVAISYSLDIKKRDDIKNLINIVERQWGYIDVLVNNAGIIRDKPIVLMREEDWDDVMKVNLYGTFYLTQRVIVSMMKRKRGRIINVSSISGVMGIAGQVNYSGAKAGIIGMTRSLAKEVANYGVTVNCIAPAGILTDMIESLDEKVKKEFASMTPMRRLGIPEEVAQVVGFLASDQLCPEYLNGAIIPLDGGMGVV